MAIKMLRSVVWKILLFCTLLLASQVAARELLQTSDPAAPPPKKLGKRDDPWGHNP